MTFELPKLKFAHDALEPSLTVENVYLHYTKHTKGYYDKTNELIKGTRFEKSPSLQDLISKTKTGTLLYNQANQAYNHTLYWENLSPNTETGAPSIELKTAIEKQWKNLKTFQQDFEEIANKGFGSYWCWLVEYNNKLEIVVTNDADNPKEGTILLVIDGWEHSWYPTFLNDKKRYFSSIWNIVNWNIVNDRFSNKSS